MPSYEHVCLNEDCNYEWEDEYSIKDDPPKICPKCKKETAKRLISGGSGKGKVELTGNELKEKLANDVKDIKKRLSTDEKFAANFYGEGKFQENKTHNEKVKRETNYMKKQFRRVK